MQPEARQLAEIRNAHVAIAPGDWSRACDPDGEFIEARGAMGKLVPVARFHAGATMAEMQFIVDAPRHVGFLLGLVDRAIARLKRQQAADRPPPERSGAPAQASGEAASGRERNYSAEAAIKCGEPAFKAWLEEAHGLERPLTDDRCAQKLRSLLGVTSRAELNNDAAAAERWRRLRDEFQTWRKRGSR